MSLLAALDRAEHELGVAENALAAAEQALGDLMLDGIEELKLAQTHATLAATRCMSVAARLLVTTRHQDTP